MEGRRAFMSDKTVSSPFFAHEVTIRRIPRFRPFDFFDIMAIVGGQGSEVAYHGSEPRRTRKLSPGALVLYRPIDDVMLTGFEPGGLTLTYVSFPTGQWTQFASLIGLNPRWSTAIDPPMAMFDPASTQVKTIFDRVINSYRSGSSNSLELVRFWLEIIPILFPGEEPHMPGIGAPDWLRAGLELMRSEANLRGGVPRLLELARVTGPHLSTTTKRFYGRTPTALILDMRLRHAAVLLGTSTESIGGIAQRCGFRSFAYFSTTFRDQLGVSPREYRSMSQTRFTIVGGNDDPQSRSAEGVV